MLPKKAAAALLTFVVATLPVGGAAGAPPTPVAPHVCPADLRSWRQILGAEWLDCHQVADLTTTNNPYTDSSSLYGMGFPPPGSGTLNSHYTNPTAPESHCASGERPAARWLLPRRLQRLRARACADR